MNYWQDNRPLRARLILRHDLNGTFLARPGHGAPGVLAPVWFFRE